MTVVKLQKLILCGAQGNLARAFLDFADGRFQILQFSSSPQRMSDKHVEGLIRPIESLQNFIERDDKVLFFSNGKTKKDHRKLIELLTSIKKTNPEIFYISSMSIYSNYKSDYVRAKLELEALVKTFDRWCILRPGFIFARNFGGISEIIRSFSKKNLLIFPNNSAKTFVISLPAINRELSQIIEKGANNEALDIYDVTLNMKRISEALGFRGFAIEIPKMPGGFFLTFVQFLRPITPTAFQSLFALSYMPELKYKQPHPVKYFRRILIHDYSKLLNKHICFTTRKVISVLSKRHELSEYEELSSGQKFIFHQRVLELVDAQKKQT